MPARRNQVTRGGLRKYNQAVRRKAAALPEDHRGERPTDRQPQEKRHQ